MYCINEKCKNFSIFENNNVVNGGVNKNGVKRFKCNLCGLRFQDRYLIVKEYNPKNNICTICGISFVSKTKNKKYCYICKHKKNSERKKHWYKRTEKIRRKVQNEYYNKNKVDILKKQREYSHNNKIKIAIKRRNYYDRNKEHILKKCKEYEKNNHLRLKEKSKQWVEKNINLVMEIRKRHKIKSIKNLTDSYIKQNLFRAGIINPKTEVIESNRARIIIKRELKKWREIENDTIQRDGGEQSEAHESSNEESNKSEAKH